MFTKENCFVWPLLILFFDNFLFNQNRQLKKLHVLVLILMSVLIPVLFLTNNSSNIFNPIVSQSFTNDSISPLTYFLTQCRVIWRYIFLIFYPFGLTLDYLFPITKSLLEPATLLGFAGLISLIYIAFKARQRHPILTVGISWFLITISVESSFIPIRNVIFEHRMYLPSIGIVISFCYLLAKLLNKKLFVIIISVWSVFLIALTIQRNAVWRDEISLWTDNIKKMPNKGRPYLNLGIAYLHKSDPRQAIDAFTAAIEVDPKYYEAYNNRGQAHAQLGENSQAIVDYSKALDLKPAAYDTLINRGAAYIGLKNYDSALVDLVAAQLICSDCIEAINNMGVVFMARQQYDEAIKIFTRALVIDMAFSKAYNNRGAMYLAKEMLKDALADFNKAIELDPQYASAYANRARYYKHIGDMANAFQDAARAEKLGYNRIQSQ